MPIQYKASYFIVMMIICHTTLSAQKDTIFYNKNWKETTKQKAHFFRPLPLQEQGDLSLIKDYYMDGTLQFEAWSTTNDLEKSYDGKVVYYYPNGNKQAVVNYKNKQRNGPELSYYKNGNVKREQQMKNNKRVSSKFYTKEGKLQSTMLYKNGRSEEGINNCFVVFKSGRRVGETLYYENTNNPAYVSKCADEGCYTLEKETYFNRKGVIIHENTRNDEQLTEGKIITFYESETCGYVKGIQTITTISNGVMNGHFTRYDTNGVVLYSGVYKDNKPQDGTFEVEKFDLLFVTKYKDGLKNGIEIVFSDDEKIAEGNYKDGKRQDGTFVEERKFTGWSKIPILLNLKNGVEDGKQTFYNVARGVTMGYYHAKNGVKEGAYAVFDYNGKLRAEATYKNGKPFEGAVIYNDDFRLYTNGERVRDFSQEDILEKERMEAFSKDSDTLEGSYNLGGFETAGSIVFLDTHQFFFSLSVGSLDLITYGAYNLKKGQLKLQVPKEQKQDFIVYGRKDPTLKDSIQIKYYNYNADNKPLLQLNKQWYTLEDTTKNNQTDRRRVETYKVKSNALSTLKIGITIPYDKDVVVGSILESKSVADFNDFIIAYNIPNKEIRQFENGIFTFNGDKLINGDKQVRKRSLSYQDKESVLDYIIENRAFPYYIKNNTFQKIKMNMSQKNKKIKKYLQLTKQ